MRHGGIRAVPNPHVPTPAELDPRQRYCIECMKEPINRIIYRSDDFCSQACSNRWCARQSQRKRKGIPPQDSSPVYTPAQDRWCGFCNEVIGVRVKGVYCTKRCEARAVKAQKTSETELSNRPLIEFVGKKKKTIELPEVVIHKSSKSYNDHLRERGMRLPYQPWNRDS